MMFFRSTVHRSMRNTTGKGAEGYTKLVLALIDRCFASDGTYLHYNSILDAADLIPPGQYRIVGKQLPDGSESLRGF